LNGIKFGKLDAVLCRPTLGKCGHVEVCVKYRNMSNSIRDKLGVVKFDICVLRIVTTAGKEQNFQKHHSYIKIVQI